VLVFEGLVAQCNDEQCCLNNQNPNPTDGNGFLEYTGECLDGGLHCVAESGCRLCYKPILGSINVGDRPICTRFATALPTFDFPPNCNNETCCIDSQNPNDNDGNGFLEFNTECKVNGGGLHCVHDSGCRLCYKPILGSNNIGDRPICNRFLHLLPQCGDQGCCLDIQSANENNGNGFLEFDVNCRLNGGGLHCVHNTGCRLCYRPVLGGINVGERPICLRFTGIDTICNDQTCCENIENGNPTDGNGFFEFNLECKMNGGLDCVGDTGCRLCYRPIDGGINVGERPTCERFAPLRFKQDL